MLRIRGLYEVAIRVRDLEKSEMFYRVEDADLEAAAAALGLCAPVRRT